MLEKILTSDVFTAKHSSLGTSIARDLLRMKNDKTLEGSMIVSQQATDWMIRLSANPRADALRSEFEEWLSRSPAHRHAWEESCRSWQVLGHAKLERDIARNVEESRWKGRHSSRGRVVGIAACCAALCLAVMIVPMVLSRSTMEISTDVDQQRTVTLEDGSTVTLSASSAVEPHFDQNRRQVTLLKGEAFFDVVHDDSKPFIVSAGSLGVRVVGTAFTVGKTDQMTEVALARGSIDASVNLQQQTAHERLTPGEFLSVDNVTGAVKRGSIPVDEIGSWRSGRLFVIGESIASVVEKIQRYQPAWIIIADRKLGEERVSGIYDLTHPDQALGALVEPYAGSIHKFGSFARVVSR